MYALVPCTEKMCSNLGIINKIILLSFHILLLISLSLYFLVFVVCVFWVGLQICKQKSWNKLISDLDQAIYETFHLLHKHNEIAEWIGQKVSRFKSNLNLFLVSKDVIVISFSLLFWIFALQQNIHWE